MTQVAIAAPHRERQRRSALGLMLVGTWIAIAVALMAALAVSLDPNRVLAYGPRILHGFWVTLYLCLASLAFGAIISMPVAAALRSNNPILHGLGFAYSYFFRGTPLIAQVFLIYYGAGQFVPQLKSIGVWTFFRDATNCAIFAFSLNTAAYQAEILAGAIGAVPTGQREAAKALGIKPGVTMLRIILPQALITALRPYGNEIILMVKASAIASIITVLDLMGETRYAFSKTYDLSLYLWAAIFYLLIVETLRRVWNALERRLTRHIHIH